MNCFDVHTGLGSRFYIAKQDQISVKQYEAPVVLFGLILHQMETSRPAYQGTSRRLVLAFDVGTTYSGISYR